MADIEMCDAVCPLSKQCRRHEDSGTWADPIWQSYWFHDENSPTGEECYKFWDISPIKDKAP